VEPKNTLSPEKNKSIDTFPIEDKKDPLKQRISRIQNPSFQKSVLSFLEEEHAILDLMQRRELLEEIFQSSENEDVLYLNFRNRVGK
jgi:hypothetical protein